jgi:hypothetical protein
MPDNYIPEKVGSDLISSRPLTLLLYHPHNALLPPVSASADQAANTSH